MSFNKTVLGYTFIGITAVTLLTLLGTMKAIGHPEVKLDGCSADVTKNTIFVLDHSDKLSIQTRSEITSRALEHIKNTKENERISVFYVSDESKNKLEPVFSSCKPPNSGNSLYQNVKSIQKRYNDMFYNPLKKVLDVEPTGTMETALTQALIDISLMQTYKGTNIELVLFSDLFENTNKFSLYNCSSNTVIPLYQKTRIGRTEKPNINANITLELIPVEHISTEVLKCRDKLWSWFFSDSNVNIQNLPGG